MKYYVDNGYTNVRIYFDLNKPERIESLKNGIFNVIIEEGKVRNIELIDAKYNINLNKKIEKAKKRVERIEREKQIKVNEQEKQTQLTREEQYKQTETKEQEYQKQTSEQTIIQDNTTTQNNKTINKTDTANSIKIKESLFHKYKMKSQAFFAFPFLENDVFNLRDYEQGLDQINRLQSNNTTMDIKAVDSENLKEIGYSDIIIKNNNYNNPNNPAVLSNLFPISFSFGADNSGNKSTGERTAYVGTNIDNLLSINDNIYLKYTQDLDWENNKRYNKALYSNISIPFGYWTLTSTLNYSKYLTTVNGYNTTFHTSGNTLTQTYNLDRVMFRRQMFKINAGTELTIRDTESFIRNIKSKTGSRTSTNMNFYINNTIYTKLGTIIIKPSYQKGLEWFNAKKDDSDDEPLKTTPRNQYDLIKLYLYYNTRINLPLFTKTQVIDSNTGQPVLVEDKKCLLQSQKEILQPQKEILQPQIQANQLNSQGSILNDINRTDLPNINSQENIVSNINRTELSSVLSSVIDSKLNQPNKEENQFNNNLNQPNDSLKLSTGNTLNQSINNMIQSSNSNIKDNKIPNNNESSISNKTLTETNSNNKKNNCSEKIPLKVRNKIPLNYTLTFNTQYSWNTLYGTDQFSIGGEYTVRGFRESTISGDNGYNIRNDIKVNLLDLVPNYIVNTKLMNWGNGINSKANNDDANGNNVTNNNDTANNNDKTKNNNTNNSRNNTNNKTYDLSINSALSRTYLNIFYDYGFVRDKYEDSSDIKYNSKNGYMSGTGISLSYYGKYLDWSLTYAKALHSPTYLQTRDDLKKEESALYWRVGGKF